MPRSDGLALSVGVNPELQEIFNKIHAVPETYTPEEMRSLIIKAYKAGATAISFGVRGRIPPLEALQRVQFWADMVVHSYVATNQAEVRVTADEVPSFVPFNPIECEPGHDFYTKAQSEGRRRLAELIIENLECVSPEERRKIAHEMGYHYGSTLIAKGIDGTLLVEMVEAFINKQAGIIESSIVTKTLRQPDQNEHEFDHYLYQLFHASDIVYNLQGPKYLTS